MLSLPRVPLPAVLAVAGGVWLLVDLVRVWSPSLITIFGQAASTPPELMGGYALGCVAAAVLAVALTARRTPRLALVVALGITVLARVGLQVAGGGRVQLVLASVGVAAALAWLSLAAIRYRDAVVGVAAGLALSVCTHAALGTWGAVWRNDAWGWAVLVVQVALAVGAAVAARRSDVPAALGRRFGWLLMPGLFLAGIVVANAGRASAVAGTAGLAVIAAASVLAVATATLRPGPLLSWGAEAVLVGCLVVALLVTVEQGGVPAVTPAWAIVAYALGLPALTTVWAAAARGSGAGATEVSLGGLVWVVLLFAYYAGYDLGYRADVVVVATAVVLGVVAAWRVGARPAPIGRPPGVALPLLLGAAALAGIAAWLVPGLSIRPVDGGPEADSEAGAEAVRVGAYNLRMGYGMDGTFQPDAVAEVLRDTDVALLSEIDRGWYLNGGQDQLAILARLLDREAVFGPAADPVWGDAVLTRLPVEEVVGTPLPSYGAVTGAQALAVRIEVGGIPTWFVSTHLQPHDGDQGVREQTDDLVAAVRARLADGGALVVGGDLNTPPDSPSVRALLDLGLVDALGGVGPTSPADAPTTRIDHLLVTPGLRPSDPEVGTSQASDHLPVLVTLGG